MKAIIEIVLAVIFIIGTITIPIYAFKIIRQEGLSKVHKGLSPLAPFTESLTGSRKIK